MSNERQERFKEKRTIKELNNIGKRLVWIREKLGLSQVEICNATGIPTSSYCNRESGVRTDYLEEYLSLSIYFNGLWKKKYKEFYPKYNGEEISKITVIWIQFGMVEEDKASEALIKELQKHIEKIELDHYYKELELKRQVKMDIF